MKYLTMFALFAGQALAVAQPAMAADLGDNGATRTQRHGAFAGARLRVPLGGGRDEKVRAGLSVAPIAESRGSDGSVRTRFGEGMEFGIAGQEQAGLRIGGKSIAQLAQGRAGPTGTRKGISTLGWIGIGVGTAIVVSYGAFVIAMNNASE